METRNTFGLTADEKFCKMQQLIFTIYPSLSSFYCMCQKRVVPKESEVTMRLNVREGSVCYLEYSEEFLQTLSVESLTVLVSIELFRLLLHHPTTRLQANHGLTMQASNYVCCDKKILNAIIPQRLMQAWPKVADLIKMDASFDEKEDKYLERIYAILERQKQNGGNGQDQASTGNSGKSNGNDSSGSGKGKNKSNNGSGGNDKSEEEKEGESLERHFSPQQSEKNTEGWGENEMVDAQVSSEVNKRQLSSWSDVGDGMAKQIISANETHFDPRSVLRRFTTSVFSDVISFTRMRPNRRLPGMTGIIPGKRHAMKARVLFAIDCSGSMAEDEITRACDVVNSSLKHAEAWYCFWDCKCSDFTQKKSKTSDFDGLGGGGTNPACVIRKLEAEKARFDGIVFITDCYFDWQEPDCKSKIFILHTKNAGNPPDWCKFHLGMDDIEKCADQG